MPLADEKGTRKQDKTEKLDLTLTGSQIILQTRPVSRPASRISLSHRPLSVTPTLLYQQDMHRKTPPWMRPQSADHFGRHGHRKKLAAKFENPDKPKPMRVRSLGESYGLRDRGFLASTSPEDLDSTPSVPPSPVDSLPSDCPRTNNRLQPGLTSKPPIPPSKSDTKTYDDIINMKFQRWFPEAVQEVTENPHKTSDTGHRSIKPPSLPTEENYSLGNSRRFHSDNSILDSIEDVNLKREKFDDFEGKLPAGDIPPLFTDESPRNYQSTSHNSILETTKGPSLTFIEPQVKAGSTSDEKRPKKVTIADETGQLKLNSTVSQKVIKRIASEDKPLAPEDKETIDKILSDEKMSSLKKYLTVNEKEKNPTDHAQPPLTVPECNGISRFNNFTQNSDRGMNKKDILEWMGDQERSKQEEGPSGQNSTYDEILNMLQVLEKEEVESIKFDAISCGRSASASSCANATSVGAREILTFLDEVDHTAERTSNQAVDNQLHPTPQPKSSSSKPPSGKMASLLTTDSADLAKQIMSLSLELEQRNMAYDQLNSQYIEVQEKSTKHKKESDSIIKRHQKFIDQLLSEKRLLGEQCSSVVKDMEAKHASKIRSLEDKHAVELKKQQEKLLAAEKVRREKWVDTKTKQIKELTVKGLEPELQRMATAHQEELCDLRKAHEKEIQEVEASNQRRLTAVREQALKDRENAVAQEREAARKRLDSEISELDKSYQDQRRKLLDEVRELKEKAEKEAEIKLAEKEKALEEKWERAHKELDEKIVLIENKYKGELSNMRTTLEGERQSWLNHQVAALAEKEKTIRDQCKKERDRHIEAVIRKLDSEAAEKEKLSEKKIIKLKEQLETELKDMEIVHKELKRKLKDARTENQMYEETISQLRTQVSQLQGELTTYQQMYNKLQREHEDIRKEIRSHNSSELLAFQKELRSEKAKHEEMINTIKEEKERELNQVYNRVKEAVAKKDETIRMLQKQRDAALEQCTQLEELLQHRKDLSRSK